MAQKRALHAHSKWESLHQLSLLLGQPAAFEKQDIEKIWLMQTPQDTCVKIEELRRSEDSFLGTYDVAEGEFPMSLQSESFTAEVMQTLVANIHASGAFSSAGFLSHFRQHFLCELSQKVFRTVVLVLFVRVVYPESKKYDLNGLRQDLDNALMQLDTVKVGSSISKFYPFFLAEAIVSSFHIVFPASAPDFDDAWTAQLYQDLSEEICGFRWHALTIADFRKNFFSKKTKKRQNIPSSESHPALSITTNTLTPSLQRHVQKAELLLPGNPAKIIHFKNPFLEDAVVQLKQSASAPSLVIDRGMVKENAKGGGQATAGDVKKSTGHELCCSGQRGENTPKNTGFFPAHTRIMKYVCTIKLNERNYMVRGKFGSPVHHIQLSVITDSFTLTLTLTHIYVPSVAENRRTLGTYCECSSCVPFRILHSAGRTYAGGGHYPVPTPNIALIVLRSFLYMLSVKPSEINLSISQIIATLAVNNFGVDDGQRAKAARSSPLQKQEEKRGRKKFVEKIEIEWIPVEDESQSLSEARGLFTSCAQLLHNHKMMFPALNARTVLGEMLERKAVRQQKREKERLWRAFQPKRQVHDLKSFS